MARKRPLMGSMAERERQHTDECCPVCLDTLDRVTLAWDEEWVVVEECPDCGAIAFDGREDATLDVLVSALDSRL